MIYRNHWTIYLTRHAHRQLILRGISIDMVEATLKNGRLKEFGKNYVKIESHYKRGYVVCVGEKKAENKIDIFTVEVRSL